MEELAGDSAATGDVWVSAAGDEFDSDSFDPCESFVRLFFSRPPKLGIETGLHGNSRRLGRAPPGFERRSLEMVNRWRYDGQVTINE